MLQFKIETKNLGKGNKVIDAKNLRRLTVESFLKEVKKTLIVTAKDFLKTNIKNGSFPEKFITIVDNKIGKSEKAVKSLGKIEYITQVGDIRSVVLDIFKFVSERTAIKSGYYSSMHILMYNGKVVAKGYRNAFAWMNGSSRDFKDKDKFRIINLAPYARKLERLGIRRGTRGKDKGKISRKYRKARTNSGATTRAPNGTYWLAKNAAKRLYPQLKNNIKFSFIPVNPSIAKAQNSKSFSGTNYTFKTGKGAGRNYLYPSITVSIAKNSFKSNNGFTEGAGSL